MKQIPKPVLRGLPPPRSHANENPAPPDREIPAVISLLKDRLDNINNMARHLRERLAPTMSTSDPQISGVSSAIRQSPLAQDIETAIAMANDITEVLTDIHDRLEV